MATRHALMSVSFWLMIFACSGTLADEPALVVAADDAQLEWGPAPTSYRLNVR